MRRRVGPWVVLGAEERVERIWVMLRAIFCLFFFFSSLGCWLRGSFLGGGREVFCQVSGGRCCVLFFLLLLLLLLGLAGCLSLARLLATTILSLPR